MAEAVLVPQVLGHLLNFDNGCQAPVLREILGANRPNFFTNLEILFIAPWKFFELGTRPLRGMEPHLSLWTTFTLTKKDNLKTL